LEIHDFKPVRQSESRQIDPHLFPNQPSTTSSLSSFYPVDQPNPSVLMAQNQPADLTTTLLAAILNQQNVVGQTSSTQLLAHQIASLSAQQQQTLLAMSQTQQNLNKHPFPSLNPLHTLQQAIQQQSRATEQQLLPGNSNFLLQQNQQILAAQTINKISGSSSPTFVNASQLQQQTNQLLRILQQDVQQLQHQNQQLINMTPFRSTPSFKSEEQPQSLFPSTSFNMAAPVNKPHQITTAEERMPFRLTELLCLAPEHTHRLQDPALQQFLAAVVELERLMLKFKTAERNNDGT
jgi:hypothetical protein